MWRIVFQYGCYVAMNDFGNSIWSKDAKTLKNLFEKAGYRLTNA